MSIINRNIGDYRRIGELPLTANYEVNTPYPLDARTLVPTEEDLISTTWWRTAFGVDTIIYKGMTVTCIENHMIYIYDGPTIKITEGLNIENWADQWKKQRIDDSLLKWPLKMEDGKVRFAEDVTTISDMHFDNNDASGFYLTYNNDLTGAGAYFHHNFISLGKNDTVHEMTTPANSSDSGIPFIPYDIAGNGLYEDFSNQQTGIYIPTHWDYQNHKSYLSIYSAHGIAIKDTLDGDGVQESIVLADKTVNISSTQDISIDAERNISASASNVSIYANNNIIFDASNINIDSSDLTIKAAHNLNINASSWKHDVSNYVLKSKKNITLDASADVSILYRKDFQVKNVSDNKGSSYLKMGYDSFIISATAGVRISSPEDVSITSKRLYYYYKNGSVISTLDADSSNYLIKLETQKSPATNASIFLNGNDGTIDIKAYKLINIYSTSTNIVSTNTLNLAGKEKVNIDSSKNTDILADRDISIKAKKNIVIEAPSNVSIYSKEIKIGKGGDSSVYINGVKFPAYGKGMLYYDSNGLNWIEDLGINHATPGSSTYYYLLATLDGGNLDNGEEDSLILALTDIKNSEVISIDFKKIAKHTYKVNKHYIVNSTGAFIHNLVVLENSDVLSIYIQNINKDFSWNALLYSNNFTIKDNLSVYTTNDISDSAIDSSIMPTNIICHNSKTSSASTDTSILLNIPNPFISVAKTQSGYLRFTKTADSVGQYDWANLDNQLKDMAANDAGTKVYIVGTERPGSTMQTCNEFYNTPTVYIDQYYNIFATAFYATSDANKKKDIHRIFLNDSSILEPKGFTFKDSNKKAYGFIAQEVEKAGYPEIVNTDEHGTKTLDYNSAFAIALAQMQEKIRLLEVEIEMLKLR